MNNQLAILISNYQACVAAAVDLMQRSGIPRPSTNTEWVFNAIPQRGELEGAVRYFKHGYGCAVSLPTGTVDFDFGAHGEIVGFDAWRLAGFAGDKLSEYGFSDEYAIAACIEAGVAAGSLVYSGYMLYYVADDA